MAVVVAKVMIDDERVIVNRFDFAPGDETGHHVHLHPYVIVPLGDGRLRIEDDQAGEIFAELQHGVPYSRDKGVSHNVFNVSDGPLSFLEIEIKNAPEES